MTRKYNQGVADSNRRRTKHGGTVGKREGVSNKLYSAWRDIKNRCLNPNSQHYHRYGGRGITMFQGWVDDFEAFRDYVGEPEPGMSIDRIDNNGNYEPGNVRWVTRKEQANNRSTNVPVEHNGETLTLSQWADRLGVKYGLLRSRWVKGLRGAELLAPPKWDRNKVVTYNGQTKTLAKWAADTGVPYITLYWRNKHGKNLLGAD